MWMRDNVRRWLVLRRHGSCSWVGLNDTALIKADGNFWVAVIEALLMDSFLICFFFPFFSWSWSWTVWRTQSSCGEKLYLV